MSYWTGSMRPSTIPFLFFFNDTATTEIYTLSLHDALPICPSRGPACCTAWSRPGSTGSGCAAAGCRRPWPCSAAGRTPRPARSEEHTSELQSQSNIVCRLLLEKKEHDLDRHAITILLILAL